MTSGESIDEIKTPAGFGPPANTNRIRHIRNRTAVFVKKNQGLVTNRDFWALVPSMLSSRISGLEGYPVDGRKLFVGTHHKAMTTYFSAVLRLLALSAGKRFAEINFEEPPARAEILLSNHSAFQVDALRPCRGVHIMRDPRDMIVSGYHYHKWTHEAWVHRTDDEGRSYQEKLNSVDKTKGLFMEIDHFIFIYREILEAWDSDDEDVLEVAYEALMSDKRDALYGQIFTHIGLAGPAHELAVSLMRLFEAKSRTGKSGDSQKFAHIRSGASQQWRKELEPQHLAYIERELGAVLEKFGYA